jgi:hypothetical protein
MSDDRDREIAELKAQVERLTNALEERPPPGDGPDGPLFSHGIRGGYFGALELIIVGLVLAVLLSVLHHMTTPDPWSRHPERGGLYFDPDGRSAP